MKRRSAPGVFVAWSFVGSGSDGSGLLSAPFGRVFRRQMALLGRFIAEFLAPVQRLVVETIRTRADARRDAVLARAEYRVLRLDAELGVRNVQAALSRVSAALARKVEAGAEVGRRFCAAFATG